MQIFSQNERQQAERFLSTDLGRAAAHFARAVVTSKNPREILDHIYFSQSQEFCIKVMDLLPIIEKIRVKSTNHLNPTTEKRNGERLNNQ
ncbi:hypothetical protein DdX_00352 [Ditylenchus destructor]|uniref:Uncharacterized protein n=1 Tax=Ditylenchus destructor TaxID=166010 RepID=A0AAD4NH84_9BILA|nr:hypothetical protein DdX_00352 [Ditylenchus destructor]